MAAGVLAPQAVQAANAQPLNVASGSASGAAPAVAPGAPPATPLPSADTPPLPAATLDAFAEEVAARHGLDPAWARGQMSQARHQPTVRRLIMPPPAGTAKDWGAYRAIFVEPRRIAAGVAFWQAQQRWLTQAEARWGVPPEIVVGIIGVETFYGRIMGRFHVLDALSTLAFDFPPGRRDRSAFFRDELEALLRLAHRERVDARSYRGSYAGAIGLPQFMPGSILRWAVDFDEDGHLDLHGHPADAVGSVAHYLAAFGWERGLPTHHDVDVPVDTADRAVLLGPDILPTFTPAQFAERGARLPEAARQGEGPLALVELQNGSKAPTYYAGTRNFYAITRYNWSSYYAMAVIDLGAAVKQAMRRPPHRRKG